MRYFIVVGEASADLHASKLVEAIKQRDTEASFAFMGGDLLEQAVGCKPIVHYRDVAFMGVIPVILNYHKIRKASKLLQEKLLSFQPDIVIPVDFAGFNMRYVLPFVKEHLDCPIVYYIAPKLWAWKSWRIKTLRRYVDLQLCILPFEEEYFVSRGLPTRYVGNPCVDSTLDFRKSQGQPLVSKQLTISLLPGSRKQELASNLPVMLRSIVPYVGEYNIVIAGAPGLTLEDYKAYIPEGVFVDVSFGSTYQLVQDSVVAMVTSGTATLETALLGTPQIVLYRMGGQRIARWVFDTFFTTKYISLVNLILNKTLVPELIGSEVNVIRIRQELNALLNSQNEEYTNQLKGIEQLRDVLGKSYASTLAAEAIIQTIEHKYG